MGSCWDPGRLWNFWEVDHSGRFLGYWGYGEILIGLLVALALIPSISLFMVWGVLACLISKIHYDL